MRVDLDGCSYMAYGSLMTNTTNLTDIDTRLAEIASRQSQIGYYISRGEATDEMRAEAKANKAERVALNVAREALVAS